MLRVCLYNEPILREKAAPVKDHSDPQFQDLASKMLKHLQENEHTVGMAGQHIGHALQICVIDLKDMPSSLDETIQVQLNDKEVTLDSIFPLVITNPTVIALSSDLETEIEASISFPGINVPIARPSKIRVDYQDEGGVKQSLTCNSLLARCIQHEVDNLNGILTIDYADARTLNALQSKLKRLKRETKQFIKREKPQYNYYQ